MKRGTNLYSYPTIDKVKTGKRIKTLMRKRGLNVKNIKEYLGLGSVQSVYHWLDGSSMPTIDNLYALSELLQVPIDDMLCGNRELKRNDGQRNFAKRVQCYYKKLVERIQGRMV